MKDYKPKAATPDALDVLQTAKNHDVKAARGDRNEAEAWCFALLTLQSQIGFLGAGNQGVARMNGGFGSRPCVAWQQHRRPGARLLRDIPVLLRHRKALLAEPYPYLADGKGSQEGRLRCCPEAAHFEIILMAFITAPYAAAEGSRRRPRGY